MVMRARAAFSLLAVVAVSMLVGCDYSTPMVVGSCPSGGEAGEIHVWRNRAVLYPRHPANDLLSSNLWQGIERTMSRRAVEALLASHLRVRELYWSEFETPLGRLRWSLDREFSGGDEAKIPRIYLYPRKLSLNDVLGADAVNCLRKAAPKAKYVVIMRSKGKGQLATLVVEGLTIKRVIWEQTRV